MNATVETRGTARMWERVQNFFFAREVPYGLALVRISLPLVLLVDIVRRWPWARELYSTDGATAPLAQNFGYPGLLPEFSGPVAVGLFSILALLLATSSIGWCTRFSLLASTGLYFYFTMLDCLSTVSKYTVISTHLLLLLGLSHCGDLWSVDGWLATRRAAREGAPPPDLRSPIWTQRLMQILFGMVYFGAAITKLHTPTFFSGDQVVYWMMTYINNEHPLGDYLSQYPLIVSASCFVTFLWEIVFVFTVFHRRVRWYVLGIGTFFHIMTVFTLGLIIFPIVIVASYLVFLDEGDVAAMLRWNPLRRFAGRFALPPGPFAEAAPGPAVAPRFAGWNLASIGAMAVTLILAAVLGAEAEYLTDHYKMRGPGGPLTLQELPPERVAELLTTDSPMREVDKLLAFELGTTLIGEHLADHRRDFRQGEKLVAHVTLSQPHEDMWLDCILSECAPGETDDEGRPVPGRLVAKIGQAVLRDAIRGNFFFLLDETLDPGEYFLRLRSGKEEIARKRFTVMPRAGSVAAN